MLHFLVSPWRFFRHSSAFLLCRAARTIVWDMYSIQLLSDVNDSHMNLSLGKWQWQKREKSRRIHMGDVNETVRQNQFAREGCMGSFGWAISLLCGDVVCVRFEREVYVRWISWKRNQDWQESKTEHVSRCDAKREAFINLTAKSLCEECALRSWRWKRVGVVEFWAFLRKLFNFSSPFSLSEADEHLKRGGWRS